MRTVYRSAVGKAMNRFCWWLPAIVVLWTLIGCRPSPVTAPTGGKSVAEWIAEGDAALAAGRLDDALAAYNSAVDKDSDSPQAHQRRGNLYLRLGKFDQAIYDCNEALKINGKLADAYFTRGQAQQGQGETKRAIDDFSKAIDLDSDRADIRAARGTLYQQLAEAGVGSEPPAKLLENALNDFDRALKLDAGNAGCRMRRAEILLDTGDYQAAVDDCDKLLAVDPDLAAARILRARGFVDTGEIDKAVLDCDAVIRSDGKRSDAYLARARARVEKSSEMRTLADVAECDTAADDCRKALALATTVQGDAEALRRAKRVCAEVHKLCGVLYDSLQANKKALDEFATAISLDPNMADALVRRSITRAKTEDFVGAMRDCNAAIEIDNSRAEGFSGRGMVFAFQGQFPEALKDLNEAVTRNKRFTKAYFGMAVVYDTMARLEQDKALRAKNPAERTAAVEANVTYLNDCIRNANAALNYNRHIASAYLMRGKANAYLRRSAEALDDFNAAIREDPHLVRAYFYRGVNYFNLHQYNAAIRDFSTGIELQPNATLLYARRSAAYHAIGNQVLEFGDRKKVQELNAQIRDKEAKKLSDPKEGGADEADLSPERGPAFQALDEARKRLEAKLDAMTAQQGLGTRD